MPESAVSPYLLLSDELKANPHARLFKITGGGEHSPIYVEYNRSDQTLKQTHLLQQKTLHFCNVSEWAIIEVTEIEEQLRPKSDASFLKNVAKFNIERELVSKGAMKVEVSP